MVTSHVNVAAAAAAAGPAATSSKAPAKATIGQAKGAVPVESSSTRLPQQDAKAGGALSSSSSRPPTASAQAATDAAAAELVASEQPDAVRPTETQNEGPKVSSLHRHSDHDSIQGYCCLRASAPEMLLTARNLPPRH